nr:MAG TPA: hypothetical protein [Caudoviricetes sp.]
MFFRNTLFLYIHSSSSLLPLMLLVAFTSFT